MDGAQLKQPLPMGTLYLVSTPIGNLEDITLRALRVLAAVDLIAAEDTRTVRKLLSHHQISARLTSYHAHSSPAKVEQILRALETGDVALVSEAGTPCLSDPGYPLVRAVIDSGYLVVPVPGPSALAAAATVSGLPLGALLFLGFLPRRPGRRRAALAGRREEAATVVLFEAPHRLRATLEDALTVLGDRRIAVCRELTKLHEEIFRGTIRTALDYFQEPRGEFTLVIEGTGRPVVESASGAQ